MKKKQGIVVLILTAVLTVLLVFTSAVGFGPTGTGAARNIKLGLDLSGGVSITYQAKGDNPSAEDMSDTIYKLQQRVESYSEEAQVYQEGSNRINIEIPGVSDANAILEELGKPGSLEFTDAEGNVVLDGTDVAEAEGGITQDDTGNNQYVVSLQLTTEGTEKFAEATEENLGKQIAIVYDGETISAPTVQSVISDGKAQITGMESIEEARNLASTIRIGSLSLELEEVRSNVVGAQLGTEAIQTSLIAGAIGMVLVMIFMIVVYALPGVVAAISLLIYTALELVMLNAFDLTLTLPGIAGIILSIGMAVDANVIIYARIREEIADGRSVRNAIKTGFQKALSAILDGNITTLIAAAVLGLLGSGSVKGFAMTLALGIVLSMFTALVISRLIVNALYSVGLQSEKLYGRAKARKTIDFVGKRKSFFTISIILVLLAPVGMIAYSATEGQALNYSLEFVEELPTPLLSRKIRK
jgi:SecD/SecF fusion protein